MQTIYLFSLILVSSTVILAESSDNWSRYVQAVQKESAKQAETELLRSRSASRVDFSCSIPPRSNPKPTSVHKLRPGDIDVVGAIGDSLTSANGGGATNLLQVLIEYRGLAWSIGGDGDVSSHGSLPNILKKFNPNVYGFSTGTGPSSNVDKSKLNLGEPGHTSHDMYQQAVDLVARMKADSNVDLDNDWKLITFFIGGNDLCNSCDDVNKYTADNYVNNVRSTLYYFKNNLKRTFINLVETLDVTAIDDLDGTTCRNMQKGLCECGLSTGYRPTLLKLTKDIQDKTKDMVNNEGFHDREDFAVVLQPFMTEMKAPILSNGKGDKSYFAPDCFHFSKKGHSAAGVELWNSMLTPVGQKPTTWDSQGTIGTNIKCPSVTSPYFFTAQNSFLVNKLENSANKRS